MKTHFAWVVGFALVGGHVFSPTAANGQVSSNYPLATAGPFTNTVKIGGGAVGNILTNTIGPGAYTVSGGGNDIGGTNDEFTFHSFSFFNNFGGFINYHDLRVRLAGLEPNTTWTRAGLMIRDGATNRSGSSSMAFCYATPVGATLDGAYSAGGIGLMARVNSGGIAADAVTNVSNYPSNWLRLAAYGTGQNNPTSSISAYRSQDGTNWQLMNSYTLVLPSPTIDTGIAVSRGSGGPLPTAVAEFRDFTTNGPYAPFMSAITNQIFNENTSDGPINFSAGFYNSGTGQYTNVSISFSSSNPGVVPSDSAHIIISSNVPGVVDRTLTLVPATNAYGTTLITLSATNGSLKVSQSFVVTVNFVNQAPAISAFTNRTINEDGLFPAYNFTISDVETTNANLLAVWATSTNNSLLPSNFITFSGSGTNRIMNAFTPAANQFGTTLITVFVRDADGATNSTNSASFVLTVLPVNDPPTVSVGSPVNAVRNDPTRTIPLYNISAGPANENQTVTFLAVSNSNPALITNIVVNYQTNISLTIGSVSFGYVSNATGTATITLRFTDGVVTNSTSFLVSVALSNTLPTLDPTTVTGEVMEDSPLLGPVTLTVTDQETPLNQLRFSVSSTNPVLFPTNNVIFDLSSLDANFLDFYLRPAADQFGTGQVTIIATDANGGTATCVVSLTVQPVNDPPTMDPPHSMTFVQDTGPHTNFVTGISAGPTNEPQALLNVTLASSNTNLLPNLPGNLSITYFTNGNANGYIVVLPTAGMIGNATVTAVLDDGAPTNRYATNRFTVTVLSSNDVAKVAQGSADYVNRLYFPTNSVQSNRQPAAVAFYSGSIGNGWAGTFPTNSAWPVAGSPNSVLAADVNGDGNVDLISADQNFNTLQVLTNNGRGGFVLASSPSVGSGPRSVIAADINGDGKLDLICANYGGGSGNTLTVLTNNGSGGFSISSSPTVGGSGVYSVAAADVNGDGKMDLVGATVSPSMLSVLTNNGSSGFVLASTPGVGSQPVSVTTADVNGDGKVDLISANASGLSLSVLTNNGIGGFVLAASPSVGQGPYSVTAADVNGDGRVDLICANVFDSTLSVLTNSGKGGFVLASTLGVGSQPFSVTTADVNGDRMVDLISANQGDNTLSVLTNNGIGGFALASTPNVGASARWVTAADVNGDGGVDLVSALPSGAISVLLNTMKSGLLARSAFGQPFAGSLIGMPYLQLGASIDLASLGTPINYPSNAVFYIPPTNGMADLLFASQAGLVTITFSNAAGIFTQTFYVLDQPAPGVEPATMFLTDINGTNTGAPEVWITNNLTVIPHYNGSVTSNTLVMTGVPGGVKLRAADSPGRIVLEYRDKVTGSFSNVQVLIVQDYRSEYYTNTSTIPTTLNTNSWLSSIRYAHTNGLRPLVSRGLAKTGPNGSYYAFQYDNGTNDPNSGKVFVTQPTPDVNQVELFWFKKSFGNIIWPDEMDRYAAKWPDNYTSDPNTMRIYLTRTDDDAATGAPGVDLPTLAVPNITLHYNADVPAQFVFGGSSNAPIYVEPGTRKIQARHYTGPILLHYNNSPPQGFIGFQLVEIRPYNPEYILPGVIGQQLHPSNTVNDVVIGAPKPFVARGAAPDNPAYVYQHTPDPANPGTQSGYVFAIRETNNPTQVEVFWKRRGLQNVEWPCEMDRYTLSWPTPANDSPQYVTCARGTTAALGASVSIPANNHAELMPYQVPENHAQLAGNQFWSTSFPGWSLLKYSFGSDVAFQVVRSLSHDVKEDQLNSTAGAYKGGTNTAIGTELKVPTGPGSGPGYVYVRDTQPHSWDRYDWEIYDGNTNNPPEFKTRQIFAVNKGQLEVWWYRTNLGVGWPSYVWTYTNDWPQGLEEPQHIVIASQQGSGPLAGTWNNAGIYYQNDPSGAGFNPNDEHALILPSNQGGGQAVFALRNDLTNDSAPYTLLRYQQGGTDWKYKVYRVLAHEGSIDFRYLLAAGLLIQPPYPLPLISQPPPAQNTNFDGLAWRDRKGYYWAKAAGDNGVSNKDVAMGFYYRVQDGFYFPSNYFILLGVPPTNLPPAGTVVPWLDLADGGTVGRPHTIIEEISWPNAPGMRIGESLVKSKPGFGGSGEFLPEVGSMISAEIIYDQAKVQNSTNNSLLLIDPTRVVKQYLGCRLEELSPAPKTSTDKGLVYFPTLPPHLRNRFWYDPATTNLNLKGQWVDGIGTEEPKGYLLLNALTTWDRTNHLYSPTHDPKVGLTSDQRFIDAVNQLGTNVLLVKPNQPFDSLALTAGRAQGAIGYVTLAENNSTNLNRTEDPVALHVIRVTNALYRGEIKTVESDYPFDEKLTLRHTGDFAGRADDYIFEWRYVPDVNGVASNAVPDSWIPFGPPVNGGVDITISGPGIVTLSDNWFITRYHRIDGATPWGTNWSAWTDPHLAEGWIKRVLKKINPYEQRLQDYKNYTVNSLVSMISQAGARYTGDIPLNGTVVNNYGLIEIYETILGRGRGLSIESGYDYDPANKALLLAAGRLADLYMLLGNEAYADASDPTIAFGTDDHQYGSEATSLHCFMNQTSSLLEEELALLRGRDNSLEPSVRTFPFYNRLIWNFTKDINGGEVAYALNYNIKDQSGTVASTINEVTARSLYPQGHGDAWGHYLTAMQNYYRLLTYTNYTWVPQSEAINVYDVPVTVDYLDERKFAKAAAAKARTGAEIVNLTYRQSYVEDPDGQWLDAPDSNTNRAWSVSEWGSRAGQGAFFDWVVGNALIPAVSANTGIQKIDRTTVTELREIPSAYDDIQAQLDNADTGLNPLGVARNAIPFDIDPRGITDSQGQTHFEQIYNRAVLAMNNAVTVFNHANNSTQLLRRQADTLVDFQKNVLDREVDFTNRLIEVFGYPYAEDKGPGGAYPSAYNGPDLLHYNYVDVDDITGVTAAIATVVTQRVVSVDVDLNGVPTTATNIVAMSIPNGNVSFSKPSGWTTRRAPGEVQRALGELLQARTRLLRGLHDYDNLLNQIEDQMRTLQMQYNVNAEEISKLNTANGQQVLLNASILAGRKEQSKLRTAAAISSLLADSIAEFLPTVNGIDNDFTAPARGAIKLTSSIVSQTLNVGADNLSLTELALQQAKEEARDANNIELTTLRQGPGITNQIMQLRQLVRQEPGLRLDLYNQRQAIIAALGTYQAALAKGDRLLDDRLRFRQETAATIQSYRYKDMAFRIFRNDALQKYRAQFDLAARYVYLAAKAYDYETCLQPWDARGPGQDFLTSIVRSRDLGLMQNGQPVSGSGTSLADAMARMWQNWSLVLRSQLGFNNPETETGRFSLRTEFFRTQNSTNVDSRTLWRQTLAACKCTNILVLPEFKRYCIPFSGTNLSTAQPGIVIGLAPPKTLSTTINFGQNFFGWPLAGGDSSYDSSHFATKIRGVGIWFANYNNLSMSQTPRVYLVPVGDDVLRSPTGNYGITRQFTVLDQLLPVPYVNPNALQDPNWIPINDTLDGNLADIRKNASFRAYHDGGFTTSEMTYGSRLVGRSVWNTRWLLIIPGGTLNSDANEGIERFINGMLVNGQRDGNGVSDIKLYFQTYSYSGN